MKEAKTQTIDDIAQALGISKTTVSRSISGKGRISATTRQRVLDYIAEADYRPNPIAKGLAQSRTYNIGWVVPAEVDMTSLSFFQRCIDGVISAAAAADCDVLITTVDGQDISGLKRIAGNQKADGVILGQTLLDDPVIRYLKTLSLPFVVIGSTDEPDVIQIDNDHIKACSELSSVLKMKGVQRVALIGGDGAQVVNQTRRRGFEVGIRPVRHSIYMDCVTQAQIEQATEAALRERAECIVCADDRICYYVLGKLRRERIAVPGRVKVASFYNSKLLDDHQPSITALQYDPRELGERACRTLLSMIEGETPEPLTLLGYELLLKASTQ